ncbi:MAG: DUF354 domain-containing protein [Sulfolobales archaeon]|nr:DUF354 domain-containing protein [Sulfolobales archaeon]MDW8082577.1 DUF354 domain-containing protein [Sulfolobales archaeon]
MGRVWIDVLTSKQGVLFGTLARELEHIGFEVLVTCRDYEYTCRALEALDIHYASVGRYSEGGPYSKVYEDGLRVSALAEIVQSFQPDYLVAYPNPSAARVAYGVGIKYIALTDSPHSVIPSRLSLPLANFVVFSECIPVNEVGVYVSERFTKLLTYRGIDEVGWVKRLKPREEDVRVLGLKPWSYIVFRPAEELATYYRGLNLLQTGEVLNVLLELGYDIVLLPRYSRHREFRGERVVVPERGFVGPSLTHYAKLVVTGGASIAREAALLGTPSITYTPLELRVNSCVESWGFPLKKASSLRELEELSIQFLESPSGLKKLYIDKAMSLEDPLTLIKSILTGDFTDDFKGGRTI